MGTAYGHIAIGVPDVSRHLRNRCAKAARAATITREAGPVKGGTTVIAFITDPDGYKIELIQRDASARADACTCPSISSRRDPARIGRR